MQPQVKIAPKKIGVQGPSMKKKAASPPAISFNAEERAELRKLSAMLPPTPRSSSSSDPTEIVVHAANYIQRLVATVHARVNTGSLPREVLATLPPAFSPAVVSRPSRRHHKKRRSVEKKR
ncbi:unnamed protein product [Caenorhabditis auriculariae]|uniref:Uncharacterized protein n=1 Tax=Caenorhabditis auriculariae TaxID=2777116 RepID=A0A8S1HER1_9PELO|nr:unnamed protein product [Caenorhabditis auriculariae]